jgi:F-type H+-transporting ATPase subunit b
MYDLLHDTKIWLFFSFLLFVSILWRFGWKVFLGTLDARIESIKEEISVAGNLRVEAQEMLAQYQRKHRDAVKEAEKIIQLAERQAEETRKQAERGLEESLALREKQLEERLERMKQNAKNEIREYAATLAYAAVEEIVSSHLDEKNKTNLADQSIKIIAKNIH